MGIHSPENVINIEDLLKKVEMNVSGVYSKESKLVAVLNPNISNVIGDNRIYISEFVIAKIKGKIRNNQGHPEITDGILLKIPHTLNYPFAIYKDSRYTRKTKFIFIEFDKQHQVVVEIRRIESGKSEINTIIPIGERTLKQLRAKLQAVFRSLC